MVKVHLFRTYKLRIVDTVSLLILKPEAYEVMTHASKTFSDCKDSSDLIQAINPQYNE